MTGVGSPEGGRELRSLSETPPLDRYVRELWQRRQFVWSLATGSLRSEHLDTVMGSAWHVLNPALLMVVYYLIFGVLLDASRGVDNFVGFLAIGMFTFAFVQRTVMACGSSIANNIGLIRSLQFPRAVLPVATVIREVAGYGFSFIVMLLVLLASGELPRLSWFLAPVVIGLLVMFSAGLGLIVARLTDRIRDLANVIPFIFRLLFYLSGIIFSIDAFVTPEAVARLDLPLTAQQLQRLFLFDPFFTYIDLLRGVLMTDYDTLFPVESWVFAVVTAPLMFSVGLAYFRAGEKTYGRG